MTKKHVRELRRELEAMGCRLEVDGKTGKGHVRATVYCADGAKKPIVLSESPSDWRFSRKVLSEVKRMMREQR